MKLKRKKTLEESDQFQARIDQKTECNSTKRLKIKKNMIINEKFREVLLNAYLQTGKNPFHMEIVREVLKYEN